MAWVDIFSQRPAQGGALAIGNFDGVHVGHQDVLSALGQTAQSLGSPARVLVPDPHPMAVLATPPPILTPIAERGRLMLRYGAQELLRLPFDRRVAAMEPQEFVSEVLLGRIRPQHVVVGFNFSYGRGARGNAETLMEQLAEHGVPLQVVSPREVLGGAVSSSRVRDALSRGDLAEARALLGRDFALRGEVRRGAQRGRTLGFPTANVHCPPQQAMPGPGIYAVRCLAGGVTLQGAASLGPRPTFDEESSLLEVHLLDYSGDLYGEELVVSFAARLRDVERYGSLNALRAQIARDCADARRVLGVAGDVSDMLG